MIVREHRGKRCKLQAKKSQEKTKKKPRKYGYFRGQAPPGIAYLLGGRGLRDDVGASRNDPGQLE
jgi:hypothetical protein